MLKDLAKHDMLAEELKHIIISSDEHFLKYVTFIRMNNYNKHDFETLIGEIKKRCKYLGYEFELGCCGTNKLKRINK